MDYVRQFKRKQYGSDIALWWLPNNEEEEGNDNNFKIKIFEDLPVNNQEHLLAECHILFPEIYQKRADYKNMAKWLASEYGVISHALRDKFSAGGQASFNTLKSVIKIPRIFDKVLERKMIIRNYLRETDNKNPVFQNWNINPLSIDNREEFWIDTLIKVNFSHKKKEAPESLLELYI